jgi:hypothetical protein
MRVVRIVQLTHEPNIARSAALGDAGRNELSGRARAGTVVPARDGEIICARWLVRVRVHARGALYCEVVRGDVMHGLGIEEHEFSRDGRRGWCGAV